MTEFCPLCNVALELHDGPDSCTVAKARARLLDRYDAVRVKL